MKRFLPAVAVLAVLSLLPRTTPSDAGPEVPPPWRCGTELSAAEVEAFLAREAQFGPITIPDGAQAPPYCVPIAAHIVRTSGGTGGLTLARLNQGVQDCNTAYTGTGIKFLLLSVDYIDDDDYYYNIDTGAEIDALIQENVVANAINVYFTPNLSNESGGLCGRGSFTTSSPQGVAMNNGCTGTAGNPSTFPHEIGHYLDLFHTHETAFGAELVDGSNCGTAGDKLCDTPADPTLDEGTNIDASCNYYGTETDGNGDSYNPDTHQIMSYAPKLCRDVFSPQSRTKAVSTLLVLRPNLLNRGCAPTANAGTDITAECTSPTTTPVMLDGSGSSDPEGAALTYAWSAAGVTFDDATLQKPTGNFPFGTKTVQLIVSDGTYNDTDYVDVKVQDTTPPTITFCPADITEECTGYCGVTKAELAAWLGSFAATDVCDASPTLTNDAPDCFPMGETIVTFTAKDDHNNKSECTAKVTVEDTTPPEIDVVLDRDALWPPNHKMVTVCIETITVTDICDPNPTWVLRKVESNEPDNDKGDGNTANDIQGALIGTADECIDLRSERMGGGNGRKYTVIYKAMDMSGNEAFDTVCVRVPHDQSAAALASTGFSADGKRLTGAGEKFAVIVPTAGAVEAQELDVSRVYLGNTRGVLKATETRRVDVNNDGRLDLALFSPGDAMAGLTGAPSSYSTTDPAGSIKNERGHGPLGIHFTTPSGVDYLVSDIFALGAPVTMPTLWMPVTPPQGAPEDPKAVAKATGLTSIHPNPFNPQTTVVYALTGSERVRIAIYDVRGDLVRLLVDETKPAGEYQAVWTGSDDAGRAVTSGIYFVRMIAGSHSETRKIVMLK